MHSPVDGSGTLKLTWKVGKYPLKIVIFHSYVSLPEGIVDGLTRFNPTFLAEISTSPIKLYGDYYRKIKGLGPWATHISGNLHLVDNKNPSLSH
jgi:hypothetical protein